MNDMVARSWISDATRSVVGVYAEAFQPDPAVVEEMAYFLSGAEQHLFAKEPTNEDMARGVKLLLDKKFYLPFEYNYFQWPVSGVGQEAFDIGVFAWQEKLDRIGVAAAFKKKSGFGATLLIGFTPHVIAKRYKKTGKFTVGDSKYVNGEALISELVAAIGAIHRRQLDVTANQNAALH